jgi:hypothetical protein
MNGRRLTLLLVIILLLCAVTLVPIGAMWAVVVDTGNNIDNARCSRGIAAELEQNFRDDIVDLLDASADPVAFDRVRKTMRDRPNYDELVEERCP